MRRAAKARSERSVRMRSRRSPAALVDGTRPIGSTVVDVGATGRRLQAEAQPRAEWRADRGVDGGQRRGRHCARRSTRPRRTRGPASRPGPGTPARSHASRRGAPTAVSSTIGRVGWTRTGRVRVAVRRGSAIPSVSATRRGGAARSSRCVAAASRASPRAPDVRAPIVANTSVDAESSFVTRPPRSRERPEDPARRRRPLLGAERQRLDVLADLDPLDLDRDAAGREVDPSHEGQSDDGVDDRRAGFDLRRQLGPRRLRDLAQHQGRDRSAAVMSPGPDHGDHESTHDVRAVRRAEVELAAGHVGRHGNARHRVGGGAGLHDERELGRDLPRAAGRAVVGRALLARCRRPIRSSWPSPGPDPR